MSAEHLDKLTLAELAHEFDDFTASAKAKGQWLHEAYPWHCAYFKARLPQLAAMALDAAGVQ